MYEGFVEVRTMAEYFLTLRENATSQFLKGSQCAINQDIHKHGQMVFHAQDMVRTLD